MKDADLIRIVPSPRQLSLQRMEFYAFVHFTVNTFTDREWGYGTEDPSVFNPTNLNADQWVEGVKSAGMKGLILTCKHHDGFCLWPSAYTDHTVAASPWKGGRGDVVREVSEACRRGGLRFGIYLSPWDRHHPLYGSGKAYDDYYVNQLTELLTNYGDIFSVWFDGACGEGPDGRKQYYDWERYYAVVRALQPGACIHVCGPDIRWCGNEAGETRPSEWSVVPRRMRDTEKVAALSQQRDDDAFRLRKIRAQDLDLGSREALKDEEDLIWYPAEVNTSIRPGWFWHEAENDQVKPLEKLVDIYMNSVGGNATFLLNIPPDRRGLFHENDMARLRELGSFLKNAFAHNLMEEAELSAPPAEAGHGVENLRSPECSHGSENLLSPKDSHGAENLLSPENDHGSENLRSPEDSFYLPKAFSLPLEITLRFPAPRKLNYLVLREHLPLSQRIEAFEVLADQNGAWVPAGGGTTVGSKKILRLGGLRTSGLKIRITDARGVPALSELSVFGEA